MKYIITILISLMFFSSCKKEQLDDCFSSTGDDISIERPLKSFSKITVGDKFDLILTQDKSVPEHIIITGGENILEGINHDVENGVLTIENCNKCNFVRSYKRKITLEVFFHDITELSVIGATKISTSDTLHLKDLTIYHSALEDIELTVNVSDNVYVESLNSGGTTLRGRSSKLTGSIEEITNIDARDLVCRQALIDVHSPLDCYINATELIYVGLFNEGNVYYVSEPSDLKEVHTQTGSGRLLKID